MLKLSTYRARGILKTNLELQIESSDTVLKNYILVVDGIELPAFGKKGWIHANISHSSISGCVSLPYLSLPFLMLFKFLHTWTTTY